MNVTFGICTQYDDPYRLSQMVASIDDLGIPTYEICVIGSSPNSIFLSSRGPLFQLQLDAWLPRKKNFIARQAHFDVLCLAHDYFLFDEKWYESYIKFGTDWDVCSNPQLLMNGLRHATDWVNWDHPDYPRYYSFDYTDWTKTKHQYISGQYFLVKRDFLRDNPMNEHLHPGSAEDVEWSLRIREKAKIMCNPTAVVKHNKMHRDIYTIFPIHKENHV